MAPIKSRIEMLARPKLSHKRSIPGKVRGATDSDTSSTVDEQSNEYENNNYHRKLAAEGFYMMAMGSNTPPGPRDDDMLKLAVWLGEQPRAPDKEPPREPAESRFDDVHFRDTCRRISGQLEPRVVRDIGELIFPPPQFPSFPLLPDDPLADLVSETWLKCQ